MKNISVLCGVLVILGLPVVSFAAPPKSPPPYYSVICDGNSPTHCTAPNSDGSFNVKVTGGTGGAINQGTPNAGGSTSSWFTQGAEVQGAAATGGVTRDGCRAATAIPTAVADTQAVDPMCSKEGRVVTAPFAPTDLAAKGYATTNANTATTVIASPGASVKLYITSMQCFNTSAVTVTVALNDSVATSLIVPAGGGNNPSFSVPLDVAANTALTFTSSTAQTSVACAAQGYKGS
jgi:hypothetical protein